MIRNLLHKDPRFASMGLKYSAQAGVEEETSNIRMPKITDPAFLDTIQVSSNSDSEGLS